MNSTLKRVSEFHKAFGQNDPTKVTVFPTTEEQSKSLQALADEMQRVAQDCHALAAQHPDCKAFIRLQLIQEELGELAEGFANKDSVEQLDALTDLQYVLDGTYSALGMNDYLKEAAFNEVHRSNMSKLDDDGNPIFNEAGRIQKGPNFFKPDLNSVMEFHKLDEQA